MGSAVFKFLSSLKLAVTVILTLAISLMSATIAESIYDTPTAQALIYQTPWFFAILGALGVNIVAVAVSRVPWKKKHIPFLLAHLGIVLLLVGSWFTFKRGLDGNLRIEEGSGASRVMLNTYEIQISDGEQGFRTPIFWVPPQRKFKELSLSRSGAITSLKVDEMLSHADVQYRFIPQEDQRAVVTHPDGRVFSALRFKISGGTKKSGSSLLTNDSSDVQSSTQPSTMRMIEQEFWLWGGDAQFWRLQAGPALFEMVARADLMEIPKPGRPQLTFFPDSKGNLEFHSISSAGVVQKGKISREKVTASFIPLKWKNVELSLLEWIPNARPLAIYSKARIQYGPEAPPPAIRVSNGQENVWLGLGDRALLRDLQNQKQIGLHFTNQSRLLPFSVFLERFRVGHNPGTLDPASYASEVIVRYCEGAVSRDPLHCPEDRRSEIKMNEPMSEKGMTFYQASYEPGEPRPKVTILSVNEDPGRVLKYAGSILIVLGAVLLFSVKWKKAASQKVLPKEISI